MFLCVRVTVKFLFNHNRHFENTYKKYSGVMFITMVLYSNNTLILKNLQHCRLPYSYRLPCDMSALHSSLKNFKELRTDLYLPY